MPKIIIQNLGEGDTCPYCNKGEFVWVNGKYGQFLGCSEYPNCIGRVKIRRGKSDLEKEADKILRGKM